MAEGYNAKPQTTTQHSKQHHAHVLGSLKTFVSPVHAKPKKKFPLHSGERFKKKAQECFKENTKICCPGFVNADREGKIDLLHIFCTYRCIAYFFAYF